MTLTRLPMRIDSVDLVRGLALLGMIVFHLAWDLHAFGFTELDPSRSPLWHSFGHAVAGCFLFLSGLSLVLAKDRGAKGKSSLKRIGLVALAAIVVSVATWFVAPDQVITFGILHCIAMSNLIALALLRAPTPLVVVVALTATAAPLFEPIAPPWIWWLGLSGDVPDTLDFRPLCPWLSVVLAGIVFARHGGTEFMAHWGNWSGTSAAVLKKAGQHSLAIYLGHQPLVVAVLLMVTTLSFPDYSNHLAGKQLSDFIQACIRDCNATGASPTLCASSCQCAAESAAAGHSLTLLQQNLGGVENLQKAVRGCRGASASE